ncbi:MAG: protease inhibitor I42 family protein [Gammaproteobacteria bacterium]|nr:protease inhibitor I42 family protein [Gammaproteobacteria bacterium]MCH9764023.1 protease inhibitor I42 family protein [Gammaproteobacteria bacterium]
MRKKLVFFVLCWFFSVQLCAAPEQVQVIVHPTCACFEVKLAANPTTGFQWTLEYYDATQVSYLKDVYVASGTTQVGAPGEHVFYFEQKNTASAPESTVLRFRHARSWEPNTGVCTEVTIDFSNK